MRNFSFFLYYFCFIFVCRAFLLMYCSNGVVQVSNCANFEREPKQKIAKADIFNRSYLTEYSTFNITEYINLEL